MNKDFYLGSWLIQPRLNAIQGGGGSVRVKPRSMDVLVCLAGANGDVVDKRELMDAVWGTSIVTEDVLTQSIVELRKAFGDQARDPQVIETIRKVGFRLLQPVTTASKPRSVSFISELRRRNVVKVAVAYGVVGWLLIEIASTVFPLFSAPDWITKVFTVVIILGFPLALVVAWGFEITPDGVRREEVLATDRQLRRPVVWGSLGVGIALAVAVLALVLDWRPWGRDVWIDPSVAVLPFVNLSDEADSDFFSDGLSAEIINALSRIPELRVPARASTFAFRNRDEDIRIVGRSLNVATILEGNVRRSGSHIRVTAQLVDVESGYFIWSQSYDRQMADVFAVQNDIALSIAEALKVRLTQAEEQLLQQSGTDDAKAYDLYLRGRHYLDNELGDWITEARKAFRGAIDVDPEYARAYAGLADSYMVFRESPGAIVRGDDTAFEQAYSLAEQSIERALTLDPNLADAHISLAVLAATRLDWTAEEQSLRRAIELNPASVRAYLRLGASLLAQGRPADALEAYRKAESLDPLSADVAGRLAHLTAWMGDYDTAVSYPLRLLQNGLRSPQTLEALVNISRDYGRYVERVRWARELVRLVPTRGSALAELADAYMALGEFDLAEAWVERATALSPLQALKARTRLYHAVGNDAAVLQLTQAALQWDPPQPGVPLTPVQSAPLALAGIGYLISGDYQRAVDAFERVTEESPTIHRRNPAQPLEGQTWLARCYIKAAMTDKAGLLLADARELVQEIQARGFQDYPPLTWQIALVYSLSGDNEMALKTWQDAIAQGWLEITLYAPDNPIRDAMGADNRYRAVVEQLEAELAKMRRTVRINGWAEMPDVFFDRDKLQLTGAR